MIFKRFIRFLFIVMGFGLFFQATASPLLAVRVAARLAVGTAKRVLADRSATALASRAYNSFQNYRSFSTLSSSYRSASSTALTRTAPRALGGVSRTGVLTPHTMLATKAMPNLSKFQQMCARFKHGRKPFFFGAVTAGTLVAVGSYYKYLEYEQRVRDTAIAQVNGGVSGDDSVVSYNSLNVAMKILKHVNPDKPVSFNVAKELHTLNKEDQFKAFDYIMGQLLSEHDHSTMKELYDIISLLPAPHAEYPEFLAAVKANTGDCCRDAMTDTLVELLWREKIRLSGKPLLPKKITDWVSKVGYARIITAKVKRETLPETEIFFAKLPCSTSAKQYKLAAQVAAQVEIQQPQQPIDQAQ